MILFSTVHLIWVTAISALLFLFVLKGEKSRYFLMGFYGISMFIMGALFDRGQEYEITLINQNKVKITALDSGRTYYCAPEKITETIDKDNL